MGASALESGAYAVQMERMNQETGVVLIELYVIAPEV